MALALKKKAIVKNKYNKDKKCKTSKNVCIFLISKLEKVKTCHI